jgi:hypothetical protein
MIRIERVGLPRGMTAFARRENGTVFVYVSAGLSAGERLAAIRETLRAAPDAGWRSGRHSVLLPALAGWAGLRWAPAGRWTYGALLTVAAGVVAVTVLSAGQAVTDATGPLTLSPPPGARAPGHAGQPGGQRSPASGPSGSARGPGAAITSPGTSPARRRPAPALAAQRRSGPAAPAPQASGQPVPVSTGGGAPAVQPASQPSPRSSPQPAQAPQPTQAPQPKPSPSPSPSPSAKKSQGSTGPTGVCIDLLGITVCVG